MKDHGMAANIIAWGLQGIRTSESPQHCMLATAGARGLVAKATCGRCRGITRDRVAYYSFWDYRRGTWPGIAELPSFRTAGTYLLGPLQPHWLGLPGHVSGVSAPSSLGTAGTSLLESLHHRHLYRQNITIAWGRTSLKIKMRVVPAPRAPPEGGEQKRGSLVIGSSYQSTNCSLK